MKVLFQSVLMAVAAVFLAATVSLAADGPLSHEGIRVCSKCHDRQGDSWRKTVHAKALDSLMPNAKAEAKLKAKLDPAKDYSQDPNCLGCHVTGFNQPGGYAVGMDPAAARLVVGVGCEACHGAGSVYRNEHGEADNRLKRSGEASDRQKLAAAGQRFDYEAVCAGCHLNHEGPGGKAVKAPFNPFTPAVDPKYAFDFSKAVMGKAIHDHFKLMGVFKGEPVPKFRAELQKTAKDPDE